MTCCMGPLVPSGVAASVFTFISGLVSGDILLILGGFLGTALIGGGYLYRKQLTEKFNRLISKL